MDVQQAMRRAAGLAAKPAANGGDAVALMRRACDVPAETEQQRQARLARGYDRDLRLALSREAERLAEARKAAAAKPLTPAQKADLDRLVREILKSGRAAVAKSRQAESRAQWLRVIRAQLETWAETNEAVGRFDLDAAADELTDGILIVAGSAAPAAATGSTPANAATGPSVQQSR